jgi:hypothetical protein
MMDRLQAAQQRYERIRPGDDEIGSPRKAEELSHWIQHDVCPVIAELIERADFQGLARWSIDTLGAGANSEARRLIEDIDTGIVQSAERMARLLRERPLAEALAAHAYENGADTVRIGALSSSKEWIEQVQTEINSSQPSGLAPDGGAACEVGKQANKSSATETREQACAEFIATRPWRDLVSVYDFFAPASDLNLHDQESWPGPSNQSVRIADFLPYCKPHLRLPCDYVMQCLMIRIDFWLSELVRLQVSCEKALQNLASNTKDLRLELRTAVREIHEPLHKLEIACRHDPQARLREACVALVQVFAAFRPQTNFGWLGPAGQMAVNAASLRYFIERRADAALTDRIADALAEVKSVYRSAVDPDAAIHQAVQQVSLVLVDGRSRRELYWQGRLVDVDWLARRRAWTLLVAMVLNAKRKLGVDACNDLGISLKDARSELKKLLPQSLFQCTAVNKGTHRLNLAPEQVFVAVFDQVDVLTEQK